MSLLIFDPPLLRAGFCLLSLVIFYAIFCFAEASAANGQAYTPPEMYSSPVLQMATHQMNINAAAIQGLMNGEMLSQAAGKSRKFTAAAVSVTGFESDGKFITPKLISGKLNANEKDKEAIENLFTKGIENYITAAKMDSFSPNDLAFAFEYFVYVNYHIYHNVNDKTLEPYSHDVTKAPYYVYYSQKKTLLNQFDGVLSNGPQIKKLTSKEKQFYTEVLAVMAYFPKCVEDEGLKTGNKALIEQAQQMAKTNLESLFKVSADKIRINDSGLSF